MVVIIKDPFSFNLFHYQHLVIYLTTLWNLDILSLIEKDFKFLQSQVENLANSYFLNR